MRKKAILLLLLCVALVGILGVAHAYDPISVSMELSKNEFTGVDDVTVSIRVSNTGDDRLPGPVYLRYPDGKAVTDFGDGGAAQLELGGFATWTGKWRVTQKQLEDGKITFQVKYPVVDDEGNINYQNKYYNKTIIFKGAAPGLSVSRNISPTMAQKGQTVTITYDLANTGNVALTNIKLTENKSISSKAASIDSLDAGKSQQVKFEVVMGSKNLTSSATITYKATGTKETLKHVEEAQTITFGKANLSASLAASAKGVNIGEMVKLTLTLKNEGNISYSNLRVTDPVLGEVFSNVEVAAGATVPLEKEVTMMGNGEYEFTVLAADSTGTETSIKTNKVAVTAVDPDKRLTLTVNAEADKLLIYSVPAEIRFTVSVTNTSESDAANVTLRHGATDITTFAAIKAGETKKVVRDASISAAGQFKFTASCKDLLGNDVSFESNVLSVSYGMATPEPTAAPQRTPPVLVTEPLPTAAQLPQSFNTARNVSLILFGLFLVLFAGGVLLILAALAKRFTQKKQSESALDHLERGTRRDYTTPSEEEEAEPVAYREDGGETEEGDGNPFLALKEDELPHMKYVRGEQTREGDEPSPDADPDEDAPKAQASLSRDLTEDEAAILSGGTGHYRLARRSASQKLKEAAPEASDAGHPRRRRSEKNASGSGKPADM